MLNPTDFDFLQSRGAKSVVPEEDRRSSLLLRFDPLSRLSTTHKIQLNPTAEKVETVTVVGIEKSDPINCGNISKDNICVEPQPPISQSSATNASEMSVSLVHDSNNMDNETNSYVNNIK